MTDDLVWEEVVAWVAKITGKNVIRGWEGGPRPAAPYVMVNFTGSAEVRVHEQEIIYERQEVGTMARPVIETEWRFSIHAYDETPSDILRPLRTAEKLSQIVEPLRPGLHIFNLSQIRNLADWQNEDWEPRAQIDMNVRGLVKDGMIIDTIEEYDFTWSRT